MLYMINKRYTSLFSFLLLGQFLIGFTGSLSAAQAPSASPELNEQDWEEMQKQVMDEIGQLPPEEQEKIFEEAARIAEKMEKAIEEVGEEAFNEMSEEELMTFFDDLFVEEAKEEPKEEVKEEKKEEPKPVKKITSEQEKLLETVRVIINRIEAFFVKANSIPELPEKTKQWIKKGTLKEWPKDATWEQVKKKVEELSQKLHKVLDTDPKTKEYRYVQDLFKDEALRNNLANLQTTLVQHEPQVEVSTFGLDKLGKDSKQATQKVLDSLGEAINKLTIIDSLNKIFEQYEPEAKKKREEQEAAIKKAEAEAKKEPKPARAVTAGVERDAGDYYAPGAGYPDSAGYGAPTDYGIPSYAPSSGAPTPGRPAKQPMAPGKKAGARDEVDEKPTTPTAPGVKKDKDEKGEPIYAPRQEDARVTQLLHDASRNVRNAAQTVGGNETLLDIKKHLTDKKPIDMDLALNTLPRATRKLNDAVRDVKSLQNKTRSLDKANKKYYQKELEDRVKEDLDKIKPVIDQIDKIKKEWDKIKDTVDTDKQYAYLGEKPEVKAVAPGEKTIQEQIPHPTSLYELQKAHQELKTAISSLTEEKKPESALPQAGVSVTK